MIGVGFHSTAKKMLIVSFRHFETFCLVPLLALLSISHKTDSPVYSGHEEHLSKDVVFLFTELWHLTLKIALRSFLMFLKFVWFKLDFELVLNLRGVCCQMTWIVLHSLKSPFGEVVGLFLSPALPDCLLRRQGRMSLWQLSRVESESAT